MEFSCKDREYVEEIKIKSLNLLNSFLKNLFNLVNVKDDSKEIIEVLSNYSLKYADDRFKDTMAFYYSSEKTICVCEYFFHLSLFEQIASLIHEYCHAILDIYALRNYNYALSYGDEFIEEGMNDLLSELVISNCQKSYLLTDGYLVPKETMAFLMGLADDPYFLIYNFYFKNQTEFKNELFKQLKIHPFSLEKVLSIYSIDDCLTDSYTVKNKLSSYLFKLFSRNLSKFNLEELTSNCLCFNNEFFYHNALYEKFIFERTYHNLMPLDSLITVEKMIALIIKLKPLISRPEFNSDIYDNALISLYYKDPLNFEQLANYVSNLPPEIGINMFNKALKTKDPFNSMVQIIKTWNFKPLSSDLKYLNFYDVKATKSDRILFLSSLLAYNNVNSFYYKELLELVKTIKIDDKIKPLVIKSLKCFFKNNLNSSNDPNTIYVLFKTKGILKYLDFDSIISNYVQNAINDYLKEIEYINNKYALQVKIEALVLNIDLFKVSAKSLVEILYDNCIKYLKSFIYSSLKEKLDLIPRIEILTLVKELYLTSDDNYISIAKELESEYNFNVISDGICKREKKVLEYGAEKEKGRFCYDKIIK